ALFRHLCARWPCDELPGAFPGRHRHGNQRIAASRHGDDPAFPAWRVGCALADTLSGGQDAQCRKCLVPVNTIAMPCLSAAAITSSSRIEPPGWMTAVAPAATADSSPSAKGKKASDATTEPFVSGSASPATSAASIALRAAMREESTRLIWPAPMPTV